MNGFYKIYLILLMGYLLGISDGYVALWNGSGCAPLQVFPYRAQMLPAYDQQALENGIEISSEQELSRLLEDYLS